MENKHTFLARIQHLDPSSVGRVKLAYTLAKFYHRAQIRKGGERYFEHCRRSALILMDELKIYDPDLICAQLLHDTAEDTELDLEMIDQFLGDRVSTIVRMLTKPDPWVEETKQSYYDRFSDVTDIWDLDPLIVKACDRLDNLRDTTNCSTHFIQKQVDETRRYCYPMLDQLAHEMERVGDSLSLMIRDRVSYLEEILSCRDPVA